MLLTFTPLSETLVVFHELIKPPRLLACQQNVPAPSKVNGIVMMDVTGLQAPPAVGVTVAVGPLVGVKVRVGVLVMTGGIVGVKVRVGVLVITGVPGVFVRVGVIVIVMSRVGVRVAVLVGVFVITGVPGVNVRVGVEVSCMPPPAIILTRTIPCEGTLAV